MGTTVMGAEAALLLALRRGPGYGLDLVARVRERSDGHVRLGRGNVYGAAARLQEMKLVRSWVITPGGRRGGRSRVVYELTPQGIGASERLAAGLRRFLGTGTAEIPVAEAALMVQRLLACGDVSASVRELAAAKRK